MGIKICPQCGGKVSDTRNDCPHCNYNFTVNKKCPDCEEEIEASLAECPICGHVFEEDIETSVDVFSVDQTPETNQPDDGLSCPFCNSTNPLQIGNDLYMCTVCKNQFVDKRSLPTPLPLSQKMVTGESSSYTTAEKSTDSNTKTNSLDSSTATNDNQPTVTKDNNAIVKDAKKRNLIFKFSILSNIIALVTFILGAIFLIFEVVPSDWAYHNDNWEYISYFEYAFADGIDALLTIIFGFTYLICSIIQTIFSLQKNKHTIFMLILGIFAILCAATTIIFAFISYWEFALIYGILACVSAGFTLIQLALTILFMCKKLSSKEL